MDRVVELNFKRIHNALLGMVTTEQHPPQQVSVVKESGILRFDRPEEIEQEVYDQIAKDASKFFPVKTWEEMLEAKGQI